jgi:hypothetical protein
MSSRKNKRRIAAANAGVVVPTWFKRALGV